MNRIEPTDEPEDEKTPDGEERPEAEEDDEEESPEEQGVNSAHRFMKEFHEKWG